jgi:3-hydroxy-3-methylglutaryl CoA synthase
VKNNNIFIFFYYKTIIMDTNRPERSPVKYVEKKYNTNYYLNSFNIVVISIMATINFAYLLKYFNFNQC